MAKYYNNYKNEIIATSIGIVSTSFVLMFVFLFPHLHDLVRPVYFYIFLNIFNTTLIWLGCRVIVNFLWKKYPWEKFPVKHLLIEVFAIFSWAMFIMYVGYLMYKNYDVKPSEDGQSIVGIAIGILITFLITSIHEGIYFYQQWKENFNLSIKLKKDNLEARYETLKSQLNPHFLFNSLNTLITYVDDNPKAADYIQNLSDFMRYVLKNREKEVILLQEEITSCEKYMFLQQSRFGKNLEWKVELSEEVLNQFVLPLTIQMLLENAIKHNVISKEKPLFIHVGINTNGMLFVENNKQKKISETSTGIGLRNIFDRYEYLSTEKPEIIETEKSFKVIIPILKSEI